MFEYIFRKRQFIFFSLGFLLMSALYVGQKMPVSLFPETERPQIGAWLVYSQIDSENFKHEYGRNIESSLLAIEGVEKVIANYYKPGARYDVTFEWGIDYDKADEEVKATLQTYESQFPSSWHKFEIWKESSNTGQFAFSIVPKKRSLI